MKNFWLTFFGGMVQIELIGVGAERLVNRLLKHDIKVFHFRKIDKDVSEMDIHLKDIYKFRKAVRGQAFKVFFKRKKGVPFFLKRFSRNKGIAAGIPAFLIILFILSNIVWSIEIEGASLETEQQIRKHLKTLDVRVGKFSFNEGDPKAIQKYITDKVPTITWVGVQSQGSVYRLKVVEKLVPKKVDDGTHPLLVASKKAYIVQAMVERGQVLVKKKQLVERGQPLVDGYIGTLEKPTYVGAKGVVLGETWYQTKSEVPLKSTFNRLTGNNKSIQNIKIFGLSIPVWGFTKPDYKQLNKEEYQTDFHFWKWKLPVSLVKTTYQEVKTSTRILTSNEALELAKENAYLDILKNIPADATVVKRNLLQKQLSSDKVMVIMHYEVIEDIAVGSDDVGGDILSEPEPES